MSKNFLLFSMAFVFSNAALAQTSEQVTDLKSNSAITGLCRGAGAQIGSISKPGDLIGSIISSKLRGAARDELNYHEQSLESIEEFNKLLRGYFGKTLFSCYLKIDQEGRIESLKILKSSGSNQIDNRAISIIKKASPFETYSKGKRKSGFTVDFPTLSASPTKD